MEKKFFLTRVFMVVLGFAVCFPVFADGQVSLQQFKEFKNSDLNRISASQLFSTWDQNEIQFEIDRKNKVFIITGRITELRKGLLGDYIVSLEVPNQFTFYGVSVCYPSTISETKKRDLAQLAKGQTFEAVVIGTSSYAYVDVMYYVQNGVARTEL